MFSAFCFGDLPCSVHGAFIFAVLSQHWNWKIQTCPRVRGKEITHMEGLMSPFFQFFLPESMKSRHCFIFTAKADMFFITYKTGMRARVTDNVSMWQIQKTFALLSVFGIFYLNFWRCFPWPLHLPSCCCWLPRGRETNVDFSSLALRLFEAKSKIDPIIIWTVGPLQAITKIQGNQYTRTWVSNYIPLG